MKFLLNETFRKSNSVWKNGITSQNRSTDSIVRVVYVNFNYHIKISKIVDFINLPVKIPKVMPSNTPNFDLEWVPVEKIEN